MQASRWLELKPCWETQPPQTTMSEIRTAFQLAATAVELKAVQILLAAAEATMEFEWTLRTDTTGVALLASQCKK